MKDAIIAVKALLVSVGAFGLLFPLLIFCIGQTLFPFQANSSLLYDSNGVLIGSALIGQNFTDTKYFHPRPSAAGSGYDAANSSGTNLGPLSSKLLDGIKDDPSTEGVDESFQGVADLVLEYRAKNEVAADVRVPVDAVTRSASGLDPHISPANALLQAKRVARVRGIPFSVVQDLVIRRTEPRFLGIFGDARVNVLLLNIELGSL